jgi:hypothetical protein
MPTEDMVRGVVRGFYLQQKLVYKSYAKITEANFSLQHPKML